MYEYVNAGNSSQFILHTLHADVRQLHLYLFKQAHTVDLNKV